jgi:hypothetical protein
MFPYGQISFPPASLSPILPLMKRDTLQQFVSLRKALESEKNQLETRLAAVNEALGTNSEGNFSAAPSPVLAPVATGRRKKGRMSEETRAKLRASQQRRWAKFRGEKAGTPKAAKAQNSKGSRRLPKNSLTLGKALLQVTASKPLARNELIPAVKKIGYTTTSNDPDNLLNRFLYGKGAILKGVDGKFSPK